VAATPWPYSMLVHIAAWAGLRAAELCGPQAGDIELPDPLPNPNAPRPTTGTAHDTAAERCAGLSSAQDQGQPPTPTRWPR